MAESGKLEKMLILAFSDSEKAENGGLKEADDVFEALINPEGYALSYKLKFSEGAQGQGTSGQQLKYEYTEPEEITFEFLFDNTGIIDGKPRASVAEDLKRFRKVVVDYKGDAHEPRHFKLVWGENSIFKGRVTELSINYKLFRPDGTPIRAVATVRFKSSIEEQIRAARENNSSPDLTHVRKVKAGDTLPLMCYGIYGNPAYYLQVAAANGLSDFRSLKPGTDIFFPPIEKTR
ncbi:MAG: LysM peptidoglycan-binding domain-containing protein [Bacteroidales bacterium]|nr:LysM peptidoglycan-binding domain-containing protein [Bacteroidales bacterium]MBK9359051.1 LysM peptidoglycan-binding domain-containing protein [Bacteroidales bacterium]